MPKFKKYPVHYHLVIGTFCTLSFLNSCSGKIRNENPGNQLNHFENITVTIEYTEPEEHNLFRTKRSFKIYKCHRNSCNDNGCKPENYEGPHPPDLCGDGEPYKKESKCSWTKSCHNNQQCETQSTSCRHQFQDYKNGKANPLSTFSFECFTRKNKCYMIKCKGENNCSEKAVITKQEFENNFIKGLPDCNKVDNKRRGKRTLHQLENDHLNRRRRTPASVLALQGYCCDIGERWEGVVIAHVRPRIK